MTLKELAQIANVSISTVSKAFSGSSEISEETRNSIFAIAREKGCFDKYFKPVFEKIVIAVVCPEFQSGYYAQHLTCFKKEIEKHGGIMVAGASNFNNNSQSELLSYFAECAKVDGIIIVGSGKRNTKCNIPIVVIGNDEIFDSISLSMKSAIRDAIECLCENGHTDIAFIGEELTEGKFRDFSEAMKGKGLVINDDFVVKSSERFEEAGYSAMNKLLSLEKIPTAVLVAYDSIAIGAMKSICEHGLKIPDDISIIGMDNNRESAYLDVPLTTITSYCEDLCEIAVDMLFDRIENGDTSVTKKVRVSTGFVKRESVGKVKKYD